LFDDIRIIDRLEPVIYWLLLFLIIHIAFLLAQKPIRIEFQEKDILITYKTDEKTLRHKDIRHVESVISMAGHRIIVSDGTAITIIPSFSLNIFNFITYLRFGAYFDKLKKRKGW